MRDEFFSNKRRKMIFLDVPVSGKAIHELNLSSVSIAWNCKSTLGVGVFFGGQLRLDVAVAYNVASDSESEYWYSDGISTWRLA
jgi:hypothetical protein